VLLLSFNRSHPTCNHLEWLIAETDRLIYLANDGPRTNNPHDQSEIDQIRTFADSIPQDRLKVRFQTANLGCKNAVEDALDWFFSEEKCGIILEDDLIASRSFFGFCDFYLASFERTPDVWQVSGHNPWGQTSGDFVAILGQTWGWATWADRWNKYRQEPPINTDLTTSIRALGIASGLHRYAELKWNAFLASRNLISSWAYPWATARLNNLGFTVLPSTNLVAPDTSLDGTHTRHRTFANGPAVREWMGCSAASLCYEPAFDAFRSRQTSPLRLRRRS